MPKHEKSLVDMFLLLSTLDRMLVRVSESQGAVATFIYKGSQDLLKPGAQVSNEQLQWTLDVIGRLNESRSEIDAFRAVLRQQFQPKAKAKEAEPAEPTKKDENPERDAGKASKN